jgi:hypothetical protein
MMLVQDEAEVQDVQEAHTLNSERRRGLRIRQHRPVKLFDPAANRYIAGQTHDVSSTGICVELSRALPLEEGHVVCVHVGLNDHGSQLANRRNMIPARIVWIDRSTDWTGKLRAGVEFLASIAAHLHAA